MDEIPGDIEVAVRTAGEAPRGYSGELPAVYRRARRRRTRRRFTAAAGAFVVLAGLVGGGLAARHRSDATPRYDPAVVTTATVQRLLLPGAQGDFVGAQGDPSAVRLSDTTQVGELSIDGDLLTHPVVGGGAYTRAIGLPDGRLVALGPRGSGADRQELLTIEQPGGQAHQRDVRRGDTPVALMAADATTAYLLRPEGVYAHDLAGGLERLLIVADFRDGPGSDMPGGFGAADLVGDRLLAGEQGRPCSPLLWNVPTLEGLRLLPLGPLGCARVTGVRLSPATLRAAFTYRKADGSQWAAVLSTEDARVLANRRLPTTTSGTQPTVQLAWQDERTVRGVIIPAPAEGVHVLQQFTIPT